MDLPSHPEVVERIDSFLARHGMAPSRLGREALGEAQFVSEVRKGRTPGLGTLGKLLEFMRKRDDELVTASDSTPGGVDQHRLNAGAR